MILEFKLIFTRAGQPPVDLARLFYIMVMSHVLAMSHRSVTYVILLGKSVYVCVVLFRTIYV